MHHYKVYDIDLSGERHYTGKVISIQSLPAYNNNDELLSYGTIISDLFIAFGFTKYTIMYKPRKADGANFEIVYSHTVAGAPSPTDTGTRVIWYLERGM